MTFLLDHDAPIDLVYSLQTLGHRAVLLREVLPITAPDQEVLRYAAERNYIVITCNRDDFLQEAENLTHAGIIICIQRRSRAAERAALVLLIDRASEAGIVGNINFA